MRRCAIVLSLWACGPGGATGAGDHEGGGSSGDADGSTGASATSSTSTSVSASSGGGGTPCVPGRAIQCACTDGSTGSQVCAADGQMFGPCICDAPGTETTAATTATSRADDGTGDPGDCLPEDEPLLGNLLIQSDADIAAYEGHTVIAGQLQIMGAAILSVEGLECIRVVGDSVFIGDTTLLADLAGLDNLETVQGDLQIGPNNGLQSLAGLGSLTSVDYLNIHENPDLADLGGLSALMTVSGGLEINHNWSLPNCEALALIDQLAAEPPIWCVADNLDDACADACG